MLIKSDKISLLLYCIVTVSWYITAETLVAEMNHSERGSIEEYYRERTAVTLHMIQ